VLLFFYFYNMSKKHISRPDGLAYSTDKAFFNNFPAEENIETLPRDKQKLRVKLDTKQRAGKVVTLVDGFAGTLADMEALAKQLKTKCGAGGSVKDGFIIVQGDYKDKAITWLKEWGYVLTKA
jgi:translation initiation factor 1